MKCDLVLNGEAIVPCKTRLVETWRLNIIGEVGEIRCHACGQYSDSRLGVLRWVEGQQDEYNSLCVSGDIPPTQDACICPYPVLFYLPPSYFSVSESIRDVCVCK